MQLSQLIEWQWSGYDKFHRSRLNLIIHIVSVPVFIAGVFALLWALIKLSFSGVMASVLIVALAFAAQGFGHAKEEIPAEPFTSPKQAILRICLEQFVTFPRFVLSGGWYSTFKAAQRP